MAISLLPYFNELGSLVGDGVVCGGQEFLQLFVEVLEAVSLPARLVQGSVCVLELVAQLLYNILNCRGVS